MALFFFLLTLVACNENTQELVFPSPSIEKTGGTLLKIDLDLPSGTHYVIRGSSIEFNLPEAFRLLGIDRNGNYYTARSGGVTCTCLEGSGGCSPVNEGNDYGCLMSDKCTLCRKSKFISGTTEEMVDLIVVDPEKLEICDDFSKINGKKMLPSSFLESDELEGVMEELRANLLVSEDPSKEKIILLNALGFIVPVTIPADIDDVSIAFVPSPNAAPGDPGDDAITCSCNSSTGQCPKRRRLTVTLCDAENCQSCTMSGRVVDGSGNIKRFSVDDSGRIKIMD